MRCFSRPLHGSIVSRGSISERYMHSLPGSYFLVRLGSPAQPSPAQPSPAQPQPSQAATGTVRTAAPFSRAEHSVRTWLALPHEHQPDML